MNRRENVLREALIDNSAETQRWNSYKNDNEIAIENLDRFGKHLCVDVMVPLGRKAYMPGQLIHTNEVLVGHYQGYFSKCSAHKAKEICRHRVGMAQEHLEKLKKEAFLWQNKLDMPYTAGVLPDYESREIIEDYDEEKEKLWREEHKLRLRQSKARNSSEKQNAEDEEKSDAEILKKLEEAELMEELEQELEQLAIDEVNDETLRKLMSGEMKLPPEKQRSAHKIEHDSSEVVLKTDAVIKNESLQGIVKRAELKANSVTVPATNNNNRPNPELQENVPIDAALGVEEDLPQEARIIKEQAQFLSFIDQIGFYECQIKIVRQKLLALPLKNQNDVDQKVNLLNVLENLEELLEIAEDNAAAEEENVPELNEEEEEEDLPEEKRGMPKIEQNNKISKKQKRRISFALEDDTLEFRKNETVSEMLPKLKRDIITVIEPEIKLNAATTKTEDERKKSILDKVEQSLEYMTEHQSEQDFDLVNKILDTASGKCYTLHIGFEHSANSGIDIEDLPLKNVPESPADIYNMYLKKPLNVDTKKPETLFVNAYKGEDEVKVPTLKEADRKEAFVDPRLEFLKTKPEATFDVAESITKSILRNKVAVNNEIHKLENKSNAQGKKKSKKKSRNVVDEEVYMSAYQKVMNEVVEKPLTEPEPLPEGKFIDAHAPKKRVSRFKQDRSTMAKI